MKYFRSDKLYCFSPPVMIATFFIEIGLAVYTLLGYKMTSVTRLVVALLVCLAVFQLAEYNVCEMSWGLSSFDWARLGYVAITLLPPLGIHLIARISGDTRQWPVLAGYGLSMLFIGIFLFITRSVAASACLGNYVIFTQTYGSGVWYAVYYYGLLLAAVGYALYQAKKVKHARSRQALRSLVGGYALFIIPTTFVNIVDPSTIAGIPSIMCGFAVLLAFTLVMGVLPYVKKT